MEFTEKFIDKNIAELSKEYDLIHGANINIARITPDLIDGLKPVQRRAIYIMFYEKSKGKKFRKLASITGDVIGKAHPHGPASVDDAIVNMAQTWKNSIPLIEGFGNYGNCSGDPAGASRYISAKLSEYSLACFFEDWSDEIVDMTLSFDEETKLPDYLPAKYPNVLLNGCLGIGFGLSSNIPAFNFRELINATITLMTNPKANIVLIPDSTGGADIIEQDFFKLCNSGVGSYKQRCKFEIDEENNIITITALPDLSTSMQIRSKIADIKENNGLHELVAMADLSGLDINMKLTIRDNVNPYKFMKKFIKEIPGLERTYPVNITISNNFQTCDYSIKDLLLEWINWRREQKRNVVNNRRSVLTGEQRANDVKIFIMNKHNLEDTINIFRNSRNRAEIEENLIKKYHDTEIQMDSLQARELANMRMVELSIDAYQDCLKRAEEIKEELERIESELNEPDGIDKLIIAELRDGVKRFGTPRRSNVVPYEINTKTEVDGNCILQLSSDGMMVRRLATNAELEPIPTDTNGFACIIDNNSSFIVVTEDGMQSSIKATSIPLDKEVPIGRFTKNPLKGNIVALIPIDIERDLCVTLVSNKGVMKKIRVLDISPSKNKPIIKLDEDDKLIKGVVFDSKANRDLLIYTANGMGQRLDLNSVRITSQNAKGMVEFKLKDDDKILGMYTISPDQNQYLLYVTAKGKTRLNNIQYLPSRKSKHDEMVQLINLSQRDKLVTVVGCNRFDKANIFFSDGDIENLEIEKLNEATMGEEPKKIIKKNVVSCNVTKVKIV